MVFFAFYAKVLHCEGTRNVVQPLRGIVVVGVEMSKRWIFSCFLRLFKVGFFGLKLAKQGRYFSVFTLFGTLGKSGTFQQKVVCNLRSKAGKLLFLQIIYKGIFLTFLLKIALYCAISALCAELKLLVAQSADQVP